MRMHLQKCAGNAAMKVIVYGYIAAALCMLVLDVIWLSTMARILYKPNIGELLIDGFRLAPAVVFYFLYVAGIVFFAVYPAYEKASLATAVLNGAVLGLVAYGAYDLTNQATMKVWPVTVTIADMSWGAFITATSAAAGFIGARTA